MKTSLGKDIQKPMGDQPKKGPETPPDKRINLKASPKNIHFDNKLGKKLKRKSPKQRKRNITTAIKGTFLFHFKKDLHILLRAEETILKKTQI